MAYDNYASVVPEIPREHREHMMNTRAPECRDVSVVDRQLAVLGQRIETLHWQAACVEARLTMVLRVGEESPMNDPGKTLNSTGVPLGDMLASLTTKAQEAIDRLNSIYERIEL